MRAETFMDIIGADFYTGVPDSQLRALCDSLMNRWGIDPRHHLIAANEGNCAALAAGYHLASGKVPVVYMQNSGEGNIINPVASLLHEKVYGIPMVFVVGWRGEPGVHDEPQHIYQGEVTLRLLQDMEIPAFVVSQDTAEDEVRAVMDSFRRELEKGHQVAFVIRKGALTCGVQAVYHNPYVLTRENALRLIIAHSGDDPIVSTTGKASRELYELRTAAGQGHERDFITVGSMGHASSIALGIALHRPEKRVWCVDGDGAMLMHLGAMAVIGSQKPANLIHIVINNGAHETVGGMPTVVSGVDVVALAKACGYPEAVSTADANALNNALETSAVRNVLTLIEVKCALGARADLGRPTTTPQENKAAFMRHLQADRHGENA